LQNIFESAELIESVVVAMLVDRGLCAFSDQVVKYWPEFGQNGKEAVTITDVLRHESGVPFLGSDPEDMEDPLKVHRLRMEQCKDYAVVESLVAQSPFFAAGHRTPHTLTRGMIVGALVRRLDPTNRTHVVHSCLPFFLPACTIPFCQQGVLSR
jgi:hypothetical protein